MERREIDGRTAVYGLMGDPVEHTLSPAIHNTMAELTGVNLAYLPFHVPAGCDLGAVLKGAHALGIMGMNVTVPHKKAVMPFLERISPEARAAGAVNTLVRTETGYEGYNTDVLGLSENIAISGVSLTGKKVVLIGAGGAARAAAYLCGRDRAGALYIANRTPENAEKLKEEVEAAWPDLPVRTLSLADLSSPGERDLIAVQCTSVGLYPACDRAPVTDPAFYERLTHAFDTIYRPEKTLFMKMAEKAGADVTGGLGMLLWQGLKAYEIWTGIRADQDQAGLIRSRLEAFLKEEG